MESQEVQRWNLFTDASSSDQLKKASYGLLLYKPGETQQGLSESAAINFCCSHEAEYRAILAGLKFAKKHKAMYLRVHCDNKDVVEQLTGTAKSKGNITQLQDAIKTCSSNFTQVEYVSIDRKQNRLAHELANNALSSGSRVETIKPEATPTKAIKIAVTTSTSKPVITSSKNAPIPCIPLPVEAPQQFWKPVGDELWVWNLPRLWNVVTTAPVEIVDIDELSVIAGATGWFGNEPLTLNRVADLARHVNGADKDIPLLLDSEGGLLDGRFRLAKAMCEGRKQIPIKRIKKLPAPDGRFPLRYSP